ncbi:transposable element Tcb2 transposase [Trichonephila clavipes]|nr:transposable element Tcb2 transposase [Trichonephila clavipes]
MITVCGCGGSLVSDTIPPHTVLRHTARTAGVMVWGAIAYDSRSTLIVIRGTLTGQRYVDDILRPHTLPWPARFPDLSPVEHVWNQLRRQMPSCHSLHDLELAVQDLWAHLPQDNIRCPINSMPDRVAASTRGLLATDYVILNHGQVTKNAVETKGWLDKHYSDFAPGKSTEEKWFAKFKRGEMSTEDDARSGHPKQAVTDANIKKVHKIIFDNR